MRRHVNWIVAVLIVLAGTRGLAADSPTPDEADYLIPNFHFDSGESLETLRIHYRTLGRPVRDATGRTRNAVLILHGTGGSGKQFLRNEFAGELFGNDQPLDAAKFVLILPDDIGHGGSSKPSDGLRGAFPKYGYADMVRAEHALVFDGLKIDHLRLVMGTSMGGMHTWMFAGLYPDAADAFMPLASLPVPISGRNRMWRRLISDAIRHDPAWQSGHYTAQPPSLRTAAQMLQFMGSNPVLRYNEAPTTRQADKLIDDYVENAMKTLDANDLLYQIESSRDYDPGPLLESIAAPLLAINSDDDLINPPELGILQREIRRVKHGQAVMIPLSGQTRGHGTHTMAAVWKESLVDLLRRTEP